MDSKRASNNVFNDKNNIELLTIKYIVNDTSNVSSDVRTNPPKEKNTFYLTIQTVFSVVQNYQLMLHTSSINAEQNKGILGGYSD